MRRATLALVMSMCLWGCSDELLGPDPVGDEFVGSSSIPETSTSETSLTYEVGVAGAMLELPGMRMTIPEGALGGPVAITISKREVPHDYVAYSRVWQFEPAGLRFAKPVAVEMDYRSGILPAQAFWTLEGQANTFEAVAMEHDGRSARFEVDHFSSGFVGSEDPCSGDVVFGSETFVQDSSEPMLDTRDIKVDEFGVFCVLEKSEQAEPELTVEGQQLVQVCDPTTPTICDPGTPRLDPPGYIVSGLAAALPGANELGVLLNALPGSEVAVEVRYRRLNPDAAVVSRARMLEVSPILALTSTISPWRQDGVLDAVSLTAEVDVLRSPADRNPRFRYFVRSSWRARALSSGQEVWRSEEVVEEYFPDCTLKCINVRSIHTVWDGTDFNDKLLNPGSYALSAEVEFERLDPRTGLRIKLDEALPTPALVSISTPTPYLNYFQLVEGSVDEVDGTFLVVKQDVDDLPSSQRMVRASLDVYNIVFGDTLNALKREGLIDAPPCSEITRMGASGTSLEIDVSVKPCEDAVAYPTDGTVDPSPWEDNSFVNCVPGDDVLQADVCHVATGWDPSSDPRRTYPVPWNDDTFGVAHNTLVWNIGECESTSGDAQPNPLCPFSVAKVEPIDPIPGDESEIVSLKVDCKQFPGVCAIEFDLIDPTGDGLITQAQAEGGGNPPPEEEEPPPRPEWAEDLSEECWQQYLETGECETALTETEPGQFSSETCRSDETTLEAICMVQTYNVEADPDDDNVTFDFFTEESDEGEFDSYLNGQETKLDGREEFSGCSCNTGATNCGQENCRGSCHCAYAAP